ncbi:MAG: hypothetical protein CMK09_02440 [Ponticaulis sp.]|nr:hypothetical protein [Ponticaulis sp.]|tara:strand:+ start:17573 stop:18163 length:591 start_codon:yes stop_codon:yes gene_type:complete
MPFADAPLNTTNPAPACDKSRWELRCWTEDCPEPLKDEWTDEEYRVDTYFVSPLTRWLLKIRNGERLELKVNLRTTQHLEQWTKEISQDFPLTPRTAHEATSLHLSDYACQTADRVTSFIDLCTNFSVVDVKKHRLITTIGSTQVEWVSASFNGTTRHSVALESDNMEELSHIAAKLGLSAERNCNYGRLLRNEGY